MTSNLFSGLRAVLSKANLERTKQTAPELFGAATIGAACILAPLAFMVEGSKLSVLDDLDTNRVALQVALSGLFHCVFRCPWSFLQRARGVASMACGGIARETSSTRARRRLEAHPDFEDLLVLAECDQRGRECGVRVPDVEQALEQIRDLSEIFSE